ADIGGTNARFACADARSQSLSEIKSFKTSGFGTFEAALGAYLRMLDEPEPREIAIGAAGPLTKGQIHLTNINWTIDPDALAHSFGLKTSVLANDLVTMAAGISHATREAFEQLPGPIAANPFRTLVIAIGTGLGVAWFEREGRGVLVHPTEAGHMTFAATDATGAGLVSAASGTGRSLSFESIISGSGIKFVYNALKGTAPAYDNSEGIFLAAEAGTNQAARNTFALVMSALATFTHDLMHTLGGVDEIIFAGGLGRRLKRELQDEGFLAVLRNSKGSPLDFSQVSVCLAVDDKLPLLGALHLALGSVAFDHAPPKESR
ncbi:MAG TPA: ROK family protein, partial [Alphaproteobacteria bacterium]|nr:ROK family protein [Alphaproteobacteria bacterium]